MDFKNLKLKGGNKKMIKMKKERGITLIALVVTIVVLLILAGVSINAIFNENGLIKKAQEAQNKMDQATENDQKELNNLNEWIENVTGEKTENGNNSNILFIRLKIRQKPKQHITLIGSNYFFFFYFSHNSS